MDARHQWPYRAALMQRPEEVTVRDKFTSQQTDRERILMNIAAWLAQELANERLFVREAQEYQDRKGCGCHLRIERGMDKPKSLAIGDLVLCTTSVGRQQNPYLLSFVERLHSDHGDGLLLRAIGSDVTCNYDNESFIKISGFPERLLWEGEERKFSQKLAKAIDKVDDIRHIYAGMTFPEEGVAEVTIRERWGGKNGKSIPYVIRLGYSAKTTITQVVSELKNQGFGIREFETEGA